MRAAINVTVPSRSLFQTDSIAMVARFGVGWVLRAPASSAVATVAGVTW